MHWEDPEGSGEEGGGRGDWDGEHMEKKRKKKKRYLRIKKNKKLYISVDYEMGHDLPANLRIARILLCSQNSQTSTQAYLVCLFFFLLD